jgi:hypothetical protein
MTVKLPHHLIDITSNWNCCIFGFESVSFSVGARELGRVKIEPQTSSIEKPTEVVTF